MADKRFLDAAGVRQLWQRINDVFARKTDLPDVGQIAMKSDIPDVSGFASKADIPDVTGIQWDLEDVQEKVDEHDATVTAASEHIGNGTIHVTEAEKAIWNAAAGGELGEEVADHIENDDIHVTAAQKTAWSAKQDAIGDLADIRDGAAKGRTALQEHQSLANYALKSEVPDVSGKQDTIPDIAAIRAGAALGATALQEHQDISGKQDVIEDIDSIREGAGKGNTALQGSDINPLKDDIANAIGTDEQWSSSKSYVVNDYVIYDNALWRCILAHSGQTPSDGTYWTKVDIKSLSNIVFQNKEKMGSNLYGLMRNGYCTNLDNANTVFSIVNYWDSALAHAPTIGSGFALLVTVWSYANDIGSLTTPRIQMLMHENGIIYGRFYESSWSSWTKN